MIKIIIGRQPQGGILKQNDVAIVTGDQKEQLVASLLRVLKNNGSILVDQHLPEIITATDITTNTDLKCLEMKLSESQVGLICADVIAEVGDEENSSIHIYVANTNASGLAKPTVIYHVDPFNLNMLDIYSDIKTRYNLFPAAVYSDSMFSRTLDSALEVKKLSGSADNVSLQNLQVMMAKLGFKIDLVA